MILSDKVLLKYRRIFMFAIKLEYVSWSLFKAREILSVHKNDTGLQFRKVIAYVLYNVFIFIYYRVYMCLY